MDNEMHNGSLWEKHRGIIHIALSLFFAIIAALATWKFTDNYFKAAFFAFLIFILSITFINIVEFNALYPEMRRRMYSILGFLKGVAGSLDEAHQLGGGKRDVSVSFAMRSLNSLTQKGFLEVDIPSYDFLDYIKALSRETSKNIFGTSTIRRPKEFLNDYNSKNYLKVLTENKSRKLVRITILNNDDVMAIVNEALEKLREGSGSAPQTTINDLPEIQWWSTWANQISYNNPLEPNIQHNGQRNLLWTTHAIAVSKIEHNCLVRSTLWSETIDDYAVFDNAVVIRFRENRDVEKGILFLLWGESKVSQYVKCQEKIETALQTGPTLTLDNLGFFASFHEMLKNIRPVLSIDISKCEIIKKHFAAKSVPLDKVYSKVIELVNSGLIKFDPTYSAMFQ